MTAPVFIFPIVPRRNFSDPAWREQHQRECRAQIGTEFARPPRTQPLVVVDNGRVRFKPGEISAALRAREVVTRDNFERHMRELGDVFADDIQPSQR